MGDREAAATLDGGRAPALFSLNNVNPTVCCQWSREEKACACSHLVRQLPALALASLRLPPTQSLSLIRFKAAGVRSRGTAGVSRQYHDLRTPI